MFKKAKVTMTVLLLIMGMSVYGQQEAPNISLSLKDCIAKAMENNLGLAVAVLTPQLRDISVSQANEKYLPVFSFGYNRNDQQQPSYSFLDAADVLTPLIFHRKSREVETSPSGSIHPSTTQTEPVRRSIPATVPN
jgi:hypothetical protein